MNHIPSLKEQRAAHGKQSGRDMCPHRFSRELIVGLTCLLMLTGTLAQGQEGDDALFIDKDGNVTIGESLKVKEDINAIGSVRAKKFEGDGSGLTVGGVELGNQVKGNPPLKLEEVVRAVIADMVPIGTIMAYGGDVTNPEIKTKLVAQGWLACDGTLYGVNGYPELYSVIKNAFGFELIEKKEHFRVPDMRGQFLRGVDHNAHRDPDAGKRVKSAEGGNTGNKVGSVQSDAFQGHKHNTNAINNAHSNDAIAGRNRNTSDRKQAVVGNAITDSNYGEARISIETRPKNIYVNWIIKAKHIIR